MKLVMFACAASIALVVGGCAPSQGAEGRAEHGLIAESPTECQSPSRVAVVQDQTGSREESLTPVLSPTDLQPLVELLLACGGELRVGEIHDSSPTAFAALRIEEPPSIEPEPQDWPANPFVRAEARAAYDDERRLSESKRVAWLTESEARIDAFSSALAERWAEQRLARRSDVWSAVERAQLFLQEPGSGYRRPVHRWMLVLSDGEHTAASRPRAFQLDPEITLVLVNSAGRQGDLGRLQPRRFESLDAAIRWIVDESTRLDTSKEPKDA
jgi:hypothetical protein